MFRLTQASPIAALYDTDSRCPRSAFYTKVYHTWIVEKKCSEIRAILRHHYLTRVAKLRMPCHSSCGTSPFWEGRGPSFEQT